jgi:Trk-type K+ transport system membrane component
MARPATAAAGVLAYVLATVSGLVGAVVVLANRDAYVEQALRDLGLGGTDPEPGFADAFVGGVSTAATTATAVLGLVAVALYGTMTAFAWQGHTWARIVLWVLSGLGLFGLVGAIGAPLVVITVLGVLQVALLVAGAVLLALPASGDWYRVCGQRRAAGLR